MEITRAELDKLARARAAFDGKGSRYDADKLGLLGEEDGTHEGYLSDTAEIVRNAFGRFAIVGRIPAYPSLAAALKSAWSAETSSDAAWSTDNPSLGQCAVTALVIQDYIGGQILRATAILPDGRETSHWLNLVDNIEIDLTRDQFPADTDLAIKGVLRDARAAKDYAFQNVSTKQRYELLSKRVRKAMRVGPHWLLTLIGVRQVRWLWASLFDEDTHIHDKLNRIWAGEA